MSRQAVFGTIGGVAFATVAAMTLCIAEGVQAQGPAPAGAPPAAARGGGRGAPAPNPTKPQRLEVAPGTRARYKVQEQFVGIDFPSDAVGSTETITGTIVVNPDRSIDPTSKLTVDLRTLSSDQSMRDGYIQGRTLETEKFPMLELVPKRTTGLAAPLPSGQGAQSGFRLVTDMTLHGVTKEVVWTVVAVFGNEAVGGRATTEIDFATFGMTKPMVGRLLSVEDRIELEVEFRFKRSGA